MQVWIIFLVFCFLHLQIEGTPTLLEVPNNEESIIELMKTNPDHEGLTLALQSLRNNRSATDCYLIVLGLSGAGKSATIKRLVQGQLPAGSDDSIQEYILPVPLSSLGISNARLHIIDTPEFGESDEMETDARLLATLRKFRRDHSELNTKLPTAILILSRFDDNRASGESSKFVKMIKAFDYIKEGFVPQTGDSNVLFLLTRFMSETKATTRRPNERIRFFENIVRNFTQFPAPITVKVGENNGEDKDLQLVNGSFELPNRDRYPENVIKSMIQSATNNGDSMGAEILDYLLGGESKFDCGKVQIISHPLAVNITPEISVSLNAEFNKFDDDLGSVASAFESLQENLNRIRAAIEIPKPSTSPLTSKLENSRMTSSKDDIERSAAKNCTQLLCPTCPTDRQCQPRPEQTTQLNSPPEPCPTTPPTAHPHAYSCPSVTAQVKISSAKKSKLIDVALNLVGQSYDLLRDTVMETSPFMLTPQLILKRKENYSVDREIKVERYNTETCPSTTFKTYHTRRDYMKDRFNKLDTTTVLAATTGDEIFRFNSSRVKPGYNVVQTSNPLAEITRLEEAKVFKISLDVPYGSSPNFNPAFRAAVMDLPDTTFSDIKRESCEFKNAWVKFFETYGTHVVTSAFVGRSVTTIVLGKPSELSQEFPANSAISCRIVTNPPTNFIPAWLQSDIKLASIGDYISKINRELTFAAQEAIFAWYDGRLVPCTN